MNDRRNKKILTVIIDLMIFYLRIASFVAPLLQQI